MVYGVNGANGVNGVSFSGESSGGYMTTRPYPNDSYEGSGSGLKKLAFWGTVAAALIAFRGRISGTLANKFKDVKWIQNLNNHKFIQSDKFNFFKNIADDLGKNGPKGSDIMTKGGKNAVSSKGLEDAQKALRDAKVQLKEANDKLVKQTTLVDDFKNFDKSKITIGNAKNQLNLKYNSDGMLDIQTARDSLDRIQNKEVRKVCEEYLNKLDDLQSKLNSKGLKFKGKHGGNQATLEEITARVEQELKYVKDNIAKMEGKISGELTENIQKEALNALRGQYKAANATSGKTSDAFKKVRNILTNKENTQIFAKLEKNGLIKYNDGMIDIAATKEAINAAKDGLLKMKIDKSAVSADEVRKVANGFLDELEKISGIAGKGQKGIKIDGNPSIKGLKDALDSAISAKGSRRSNLAKADGVLGSALTQVQKKGVKPEASAMLKKMRELGVFNENGTIDQKKFSQLLNKIDAEQCFKDGKWTFSDSLINSLTLS